MKIDFLNLSIDKQEERDKYLAILNEVLIHGRIINGPELTNFENNIAQYLSVKYAIGVSNGTDALYLALKALGIGQGDEVIIPCLSWLSTAHVVQEIGATPVFADIGDDLNISLDSIINLTTDKTKAIICVHFMGRPCEMKTLSQYAKDNELYLIEDASQSFGAQYNGQRTGALGDIACFSLNPMKAFGALGEAGLVTTNNEKIKQKIHELRYCGMIDKQYSSESSLNFRMDTIQAAFLSYRLKNIDETITRRANIAKKYDLNFPLENKLPEIQKNCISSHYGHTLLVNNRDEFIKSMKDFGIETKIQHYPLMCDQRIYMDCRAEKENGSNIVEKIINIPCHENLSSEEVKYIIKCVSELL